LPLLDGIALFHKELFHQTIYFAGEETGYPSRCSTHETYGFPDVPLENLETTTGGEGGPWAQEGGPITEKRRG